MRDDFNKGTKELLAKRVGFLCSNPNCKCPTIGPNEDQTKSTSIGVAAHITAAAAQGPRYDPKLTEAERSHYSNGIWLCSNCSTKIDKNPEPYSVEILNEWKKLAETSSQNNLGNRSSVSQSKSTHIEGLLEYESASKKAGVPSHLNKTGEPIFVGHVIYDSEMTWKYKLLLFNQSSEPILNMRIFGVRNNHLGFCISTNLPPVNNLKPFDNFILACKFDITHTGTGSESSKKISETYPSELHSTKIYIEYQDLARKKHYCLLKFQDNYFVGEELDEKPQNI